MKYNLKEMARAVNKKYKEMVYQSEPKREVLLEGKFRDYQFYILNLGTHPTAYIEIHSNSKLYGKGYFEIYELGLDIDVHGGLTYANGNLYTDSDIKTGWFIGWDYGHFGDYLGYEKMFPVELQTQGKKWTTEEIFEEVCCAIDQIIDFEERNL